jgi:Kef-type K+ transport system membrane component KefB
MEDQIIIFFSVIGGAALIPFFARKFMIPSAALEIIYGAVLFNLIILIQPEWFSLLKEFGLIYLMFIVGMELDLRKFIKDINFVWYILIPLLSLIITPSIFHLMGYPFYLGIVIAMISAGIIIPVLKETGIIDTHFGRVIIGIALTGELLSILILVGVDIYHRYGVTVRAGVEGTKIIFLFVIAGLFLRFLYIIAWWNPQKVERVMESDDPVEEGIRVIIFMAFSGALVAYTTGLEPILGSFMAGLVFSYVFKSKGRFEDKINAVGFGFFTPFFFIGIGANLNIELLKSPSTLLLSAIFTILVFASNLFPVLLSYFMRLKIREALGLSFVLSAPLSMMVVAGTLGVKMKFITDSMNNALILTAVTASIIFPSLFRMIARRPEKEESPK